MVSFSFTDIFIFSFVNFWWLSTVLWMRLVCSKYTIYHWCFGWVLLVDWLANFIESPLHSNRLGKLLFVSCCKSCCYYDADNHFIELAVGSFLSITLLILPAWIGTPVDSYRIEFCIVKHLQKWKIKKLSYFTCHSLCYSLIEWIGNVIWTLLPTYNACQNPDFLTHWDFFQRFSMSRNPKSIQLNFTSWKEKSVN